MLYDNKESSAPVQIANIFATFFQQSYSDHACDEYVYPFEIKSFDILHLWVLTEEEVFIGMQNLKYCIRSDSDSLLTSLMFWVSH